MHGVLVIDKPAGMSSAAAVERVRRELAIDRAGHGGTLDPIATGVLPICLGAGTKLAQTDITLESMGCTVETAVNGLRALDRHASGEFSLIFMDCQMPEMDGYEATATLRRTEGPNQRVRVVALTADAISGCRERCLNAGMDDFISKPVRLEDLIHALDDRLATIA